MKETTIEVSELQQQMLDAIDEAVVLSDSSGIILKANAAANRLFGDRGGEIEGRELTALLGHDQAEQHKEAMNEALGVRRPRTYQAPQGDEKGSRAPLQVSVVVGELGDGRRILIHRWQGGKSAGWPGEEFSGAGAPEGSQAAGAAAQSSGDAAEPLGISAATFAKVFRSAPMLMSVSTFEDGVLLEVNEAFQKKIGLDRRDLLGKSLSQLGILSRSEQEKMNGELAARGRIQELELTLRCAEGAEVICLCSGEIVEVDGNRRLIFSANDITERRKAELVRQLHLNNLQTIFHAVPNILMLIDGDGRVVDINNRGREFTGRPKEEIVGRLGGEVLGCLNSFAGRGCGRNPDCRLCPVRCRVASTLETGRSHIDEEAAMTFVIDGEQTTLDLLISTVPVNFGEGQRVLLLLSDITERKRSEREAHSLAAQLYQAQKMESIGRLAGGVAHDLNNLLAPIHGYGEMLVEDIVEHDPRHDFASQIVNGAERASRLIRQLLVFSRKQVMQFKQVDLNEVVERFRKLLRRTIREDIELAFQLSSRLPQVIGDVGQLEQVLMNLAINAQDAMPEGGSLTIATGPADKTDEMFLGVKGVEPKRLVKLTVADTGCGMEQAVREKIFEPFFTTKAEEQGTGLGLSTVYGIIEQHGGFVDAQSSPGRGTVFRIYLPVDEDDENTAPEANEAPLAAGGGQTILVAEDDERLRRLAVFALERRGYTVFSAEDGRAALELLDGYEGPIELLLTDVIMPNMNGRELSAHLQRRYPGLKVVYMSGYDDNIVTSKGIITEGVNFIEKPFSIKTLTAKVQNVLAPPE